VLETFSFSIKILRICPRRISFVCALLSRPIVLFSLLNRNIMLL